MNIGSNRLRCYAQEWNPVHSKITRMHLCFLFRSSHHYKPLFDTGFRSRSRVVELFTVHEREFSRATMTPAGKIAKVSFTAFCSLLFPTIELELTALAQRSETSILHRCIPFLHTTKMLALLLAHAGSLLASAGLTLELQPSSW